MEKEQLEALRSKLEQMRQDILRDTEQTINEMTTQAGNIPDPTDRASVESDRSFELRLRSRERKLMDKIDEALARMEEGTYGICDSCGVNIGIKRLEARPVAKFCIECKTRQEKEEKEQGR